jgi:hypothetical protein
VPFAASFSFPQPAVVLLEDGEATLLRAGERFEDLVRRDHGAFPDQPARRQLALPHAVAPEAPPSVRAG